MSIAVTGLLNIGNKQDVVLGIRAFSALFDFRAAVCVSQKHENRP